MGEITDPKAFLDAVTPRDEVSAFLEIEQALLGAILLSPDAGGIVLTMLREEDFGSPVHGRIFRAMQEIDAEGQRILPMTVAARLASDSQLMNVGGSAYIVRLATECPGTLYAEDYARAVRELSARRQIEAAALDAVDAARRPLNDIASSEIIGALENNLTAIAAGRRATETTADVCASILQRIEHPDTTMVQPSTVAALDATIGGMGQGEMLVIAGRPGMGKTALALEIALGVARTGRGVLFLSCEMPPSQIVSRLLSRLSYDTRHAVTYEAIRKAESGQAQLSRDARDTLAECAVQLQGIPLVVRDASGWRVSDCRSAWDEACREWKRDGIDGAVCVVDYLQLLRPSVDRRGNKVAEVTDVSGDLKQAALRSRRPWVVLSQLSRAVENREDKRPNLSDLRESGAIEQDADAVIFPFREEHYLRREVEAAEIGTSERALAEANLDRCARTIEIAVEKNRHGPTGMAKAHALMGWNYIGGIKQ